MKVAPILSDKLYTKKYASPLKNKLQADTSYRLSFKSDRYDGPSVLDIALTDLQNTIEDEIDPFINKYRGRYRKIGNIGLELQAVTDELKKQSNEYFRTEIIDHSNPKMIRAAVLGNIACGLPNVAEENIEEYVSLPESLFGRGEFYILRARGESMIEAGIEDGDLVVIRKQSDANDGDIIVALVEEEATLKRLYRDEENGRIILHPENKDMSDIVVDNCIIQGIAVKVIKDLN